MPDPSVRLPGTGWREPSPDRRDRALYAAVPDIAALPDEANLEALLPPVMDQSVVGACTGYSAATVAYVAMVKDGHRRPFIPSPVFLYREARVIGGYVEEDAGAEIRNVWKAANRLGLPPMSNLRPRFKDTDLPDPNTWLFPENSIWRRKPAPSHYADAERRQVIAYYRLATLADVLKCLADGYPVNFGFTVFRSFYGPGGPRYDVPDRQPNDRSLGGHAVTAFGYSKRTGRLLCRNQWGQDAHEGRPNFTLSFAFYETHGGDAWSCRMVEGHR